MSNSIVNDIEKDNHNGFPLFVFTGKALEKAGGKEFLETVKELRKSQGPLEVAEGECGIGPRFPAQPHHLPLQHSVLHAYSICKTKYAIINQRAF